MLARMQCRHWEHQGRAPRVFEEARQANLEKPGKAKDGCILVDHTRPITCMQSIWRTYSSAVARSKQLRDWVKAANLVLGESAEAAAVDVCSWLMGDHPFGSAQDYSSAFDTMMVKVSIAMLRTVGLPPGICDVFNQVWTNQRRLVQWQQHTAKELLCTAGAATPQGEPMGIFITLL